MKVAPVEPRTLFDGTGGRFSTCAAAIPVHMAFACLADVKAMAIMVESELPHSDARLESFGPWSANVWGGVC